LKLKTKSIKVLEISILFSFDHLITYSLNPMCNPSRGCGVRLGTILVLQIWKPYGLGRDVVTGSDININRHAADTRIGPMDSSVPVEAMAGGDC